MSRKARAKARLCWMPCAMATPTVCSISTANWKNCSAQASSISIRRWATLQIPETSVSSWLISSKAAATPKSPTVPQPKSRSSANLQSGGVIPRFGANSEPKALPTRLQIAATAKVIEERKNPVQGSRNRQEFGARRQSVLDLVIHDDSKNHANADQDESVAALPQYANPNQHVEGGRAEQNEVHLKRECPSGEACQGEKAGCDAPDDLNPTLDVSPNVRQGT